MSLETDGVWRGGLWAPTVWADGVWREGGVAPQFSGPIPDITAGFNTGTHQYDLSVYFTGATSYAIAPAVETGWSFNTGTAVLEIDTDAAGAFGPYIVTGTNVDGDTPSNSFDVFVVKSGGASAVAFLVYSWNWDKWQN